MKALLMRAAVFALAGTALSTCASGIPRGHGIETAMAAAFEKALERGPGNESAGPPGFQVHPPFFRLGLLKTGETRMEKATLKNVSGKPLVVQELTVSGLGFSFLTGSLSMRLWRLWRQPALSVALSTAG